LKLKNNIDFSVNTFLPVNQLMLGPSFADWMNINQLNGRLIGTAREAHIEFVVFPVFSIILIYHF